MSKVIGRVVSTVRQIASWYASPAGVISAAALFAALGLSATGFEWPAIWVLVAWLGVLLPYKLDRERTDRSKQYAALSKRLDRVARSVDGAQAEVAVTRSELSVTPTIEELSEWQETLERRAAAAEAKLTSLDQHGESLRLQRQSIETLHDQRASLREYIDAEVTSLQAELASLRADPSADASALPEA